MNDKVYIVTAGCYSDYRIVAVFSTKEKADEFCDTKDSDYDVNEYTMDDKPVKREVGLYYVSLDIGTKKVLCCQKFGMDAGYFIKDMVQYDGRERAYLSFCIEGDSVERVTKIASERFGAVIANEQTMYPRLRQEIIDFSYNRYPRYDFLTGEILMDDSDEFVEELYTLPWNELIEMDDEERNRHLPKDIKVKLIKK